jgi:deoxyribonuclease-4
MTHQKTIWLGAHTSAAGGVHNALYEGQAIDATTIQLFTSNQRQWHSCPVPAEEIFLWEKALKETGIGQVMSHAGYLINLGSSKKEILAKSRQAFAEEIDRCQALSISYLNVHPGAAVGQSEAQCLENIVESLLQQQDRLASGKLRILLETTAGQGSCIGYRFEHIAELISQTHRHLPIGVTIDTCHVFAAGYDIRTQEGWDATLRAFDQIIGLDYLYAFHLNDSVQSLGSRVDRHASLGKGQIGIDSFRYLMQCDLTRAHPKYLETPEGPVLWKKEIALLRSYLKYG